MLRLQEEATFEYFDIWSAKSTWGGLDPPEEGSLVVIPAGKTVMIDVDTPVLKMLLIQGRECNKEIIHKGERTYQSEKMSQTKSSLN